MQELANVKENKITSLELVEQINVFRSEIDGKAKLLHKNLLEVIRDEFEDEIGELKIQPTSYKDVQGKERTMFELTHAQAKQVLVRESKAVRKATIRYIKELEAKATIQIAPTTLEDMMIYQLQELKQVKNEIDVLKKGLEVLQAPQTQSQAHPIKDKLYSSGEIGKAYGLSGRMVNITLKDAGVLFYRRNRPVLYARYRAKGFMKRRRNHDYWTEKGKVFIEQVLKERV